MIIKSIVVIKDYATSMWKVYGHTYDSKVVELFVHKSQSKCDDWADSYAEKNNMYYSRSEGAYYKHSHGYYRGY